MKNNLNDLVKKLHTVSNLSFMKLSSGSGVSSQAIHNWASGVATQTPDVRMLALLLESFTPDEVASAIKTSATQLRKRTRC